MATNFDIRQSETRVLQDQITSAVITGMDSALASINNELTAPGRLIAQTTPSLIVSVNSGTVTNPLTGKQRVLPFINNVPVSFAGGTITFPSTSGTITVSPGTNGTITIPANRFAAILVQLTTAGQLNIVVGSIATSLGAVVVPSGNAASLSLGYIVVQTNGSGTIQPITNTGLYQFVGGGGGGSSSGSGTGDDIDSLNYNASFNESFSVTPAVGGSVNISAGFTNATFNSTGNYWSLLFDASKTVTGTGTAMTMSSAPAFTVKVGDILTINGISRKITVVTTQTSYTIEAAFPIDPTTVVGNVSQALYTADLNNFSAGGNPISAVFTDTINQVLVNYLDGGSPTLPAFNVIPPVVAWSGSATNAAGSWTPSQAKPSLFTGENTSTSITPAGSGLFLRFYSNAGTGGGTVYFFGYKAFFHYQAQTGTTTPNFFGATLNGGPLTMKEISTPANPLSGYLSFYPKVDGNLYTKNAAGVEVQVGSGTSGSKNYISSYIASTSGNVQNPGNGNFENGTTSGWSLAHSALTSLFPSSVASAGNAFSAVSGGSAASGNLTFSAVSSGQLAGTGSGSLASSAASVAGDMLISNAFYIDTEDQSKMLSFSFYYKALSGAANLSFAGNSSNSYALYIYDVTNAAWIQPAGVYNLVQNSGAGYATGTFQASSNSIQYQIALVNINASTGAYTILLDDVVVGPQRIPTGPAMTDWAPYTPTVLGLGSATVNYAFWRRVGDSLQVQASITAGTVTGVTASVSLPPGPVIDPSVSSLVTTGLFGRTGTAATYQAVLANGNTGGAGNTILTFGRQDVSAGMLNSVTGTNLVANGETIAFTTIGIKISGWSSNTSVSNDTDTRVVAFNANNPNGTPTASFTGLNYQTVALDTHAGYSAGTYTIPVAGYYEVYAQMDVNGSVAAATVLFLQIFKNGAVQIQGAQSAGGNSELQPSTQIVLSCKAGDTITVQSRYLGTIAGPSWNSANTSLSVKRLSGPAVIAATEIIAAKMNSCSTSFTVSGNVTAIFSVKEFDTHNAITLGSGIFTCPVSGFYRVSSYISATGNTGTAAGNICSMRVLKNGATASALGTIVSQQSANAFNHIMSGSSVVQCNSGDTLAIQVSNQDSTFIGAGNVQDTWASFERLKN